MFSAYPQHIYTNILNYYLTLFELCRLVSFLNSSFAGLTGLEPAILGLTNLRCIPLKLQTNLSVSPNSHLILTYLNFASFKVSATYVGPTGIEPVPLVLQTSVRTSYTKGPLSPSLLLLVSLQDSIFVVLVLL